MTTIFAKTARCAICGTESEYSTIGSTNAFGSPDLDTRPPEMRRSTIFAWVEHCPGCGYCASDISNASAEATVLVRSPEYARQISDTTCPELANHFMCKALIDVRSGNVAEAAWALIHAAWVCDDGRMSEPAKSCRSKAADMIEKALASGTRFMEQDGADTAIRADVLRRAGRHDEGRKLIAAKRPTITEGLILKILDFQEELLIRGDEERHTIAEALGEDA
jgi:hypothetical protein